ncbi:MAG TPA: energy transducer TonB [Candidatus Solibacter sp.]|nr:energy transducer TonB [Candidatus Solibacter sp.]
MHPSIIPTCGACLAFSLCMAGMMFTPPIRPALPRREGTAVALAPIPALFLPPPRHNPDPCQPIKLSKPGALGDFRGHGTVRLAVIIDIAGHIRELRVLSGHPMLINAAVDAARHWKFAPVIFKGEPVEVQSCIDVVFHP